MEWYLMIKVGMCIGMWCSVDMYNGFSSWEDCNKEREAIILTMKVPTDHVLVAQCFPVIKAEIPA